MAKRADSVYEPGVRSGSWLKIKAARTCDCVIAGYTQGRGGRSPAFGALVLGLYDRGVLVPAGKVGTGFPDALTGELMQAFAPHIVPGPHFQGFPKSTVWLAPVLVCEVGYLAATRDRKLRMPRFIRLRDDKPAADCTADQLAGPAPPLHRTGSPAPDEQPVSEEPPMSEEKPAPKNLPASGKLSAPEKPPAPGPHLSLRSYHAKRNFSVTPEPAGAPDMSGNRFVVQEHHSHKLHYDFRLERDGVLKSWAVPKGIPETAGAKHLAVAVEDHPLEYITFAGTIPQGEYGAGTVAIWDSGTYETKHWDDAKIEVMLHGKRLAGLYVLVKFKRAGEKDWLLFRAG